MPFLDHRGCSSVSTLAVLVRVMESVIARDRFSEAFAERDQETGDE